jgi:RNA polymerase sigma factor (sigma-70 family)
VNAIICWNTDIDRDALVTENLGLVHHIVKQMYRGSHVRKIGYEDAVAIGNLTLVRCARRFKPSKGFAFSTYVCRSIQLEITRHATYRGRSIYLYQSTFENPEGTPEFSYDPEDRFPFDKEVLPGLLAQLPDRWRQCIEMKFGLAGYDKMTYDEMAPHLGVTRSRAGQLVQAGLKMLREAARS